MYMYICTYNVHVCVEIKVHVFMGTCAYMYIKLYIHVHVLYMCTYMHIFVRTTVCIYTCTLHHIVHDAL